MTHQSVEGSDAAVPADLVRLSLRRRGRRRTSSRTCAAAFASAAIAPQRSAAGQAIR